MGPILVCAPEMSETCAYAKRHNKRWGTITLRTDLKQLNRNSISLMICLSLNLKLLPHKIDEKEVVYQYERFSWTIVQSLDAVKNITTIFRNTWNVVYFNCVYEKVLKGVIIAVSK